MRRLPLVAGLVAALVPLACGSGDRAGPATPQRPTGALVYASAGDLYAMSIDRSRVLRLTHTQTAEWSPAVSADGDLIAYSTGTAVLVMNLNGTGRRRLVTAPAGQLSWASDPAWSADGRTIFIDRGGNTEEGLCGSIFEVKADGSGLRLLAHHPSGYDYSSPAASADGRVAFNSAECDPSMFPDARLMVVDRSGHRTADLRRLPPPAMSYWRPTWSPDGRQVAFENEQAECADDCFARIYVANRDGSHPRRLTPKGLFGRSPAWSPDGRWIAFVGERGYSLEDLFVIHPDGTGLTRLTRTGENDHPSSPAWLSRLPRS